MKRLLLAVMLFLISMSLMAEWMQVGESDDKGGYTAYVDLASIRKWDNRAKMWTLFDYKVEQKVSGVNFLSKKIRYQYDCKEAQMRVLAFSLFSWNMERGELIRAYNQPQKWQKVQPESVGEAEWKVACGEE